MAALVINRLQQKSEKTTKLKYQTSINFLPTILLQNKHFFCYRTRLLPLSSHLLPCIVFVSRTQMAFETLAHHNYVIHPSSYNLLMPPAACLNATHSKRKHHIT